MKKMELAFIIMTLKELKKQANEVEVRGKGIRWQFALFFWKQAQVLAN